MKNHKDCIKDVCSENHVNTIKMPSDDLRRHFMKLYAEDGTFSNVPHNCCILGFCVPFCVSSDNDFDRFHSCHLVLFSAVNI